MENRRDFLKIAATGALALGAQSKLGFARILDQHEAIGKSRVVIARDAALHGTSAQPDEKRVGRFARPRHRSLHRPRAPGRSMEADCAREFCFRRQGHWLKINGLGGKGICTHHALVMAVAERLQQIGVKPGNILIWDQNDHFLEACGFTINTNPNQIRCYSRDQAGFEDQQATWGTARIRITKILTRECAMVINMPILKDHSGAGVTFAMKNMYGVVDRPQDLHAGGCNPGVADLNCIPVIREKVHFTIGDAISSVYDGGPGFHPERLWYPNALMVGEDRVALDQIAWQMIERKRAEVGMPTLEAAGRPPRYIATAADAAHRLGTNDPQRMHLMEV